MQLQAGDFVKLASCHETTNRQSDGDRDGQLTIALAGNANVGKSVIFNQLTGSHQIIGNWPGKTVERARGSLRSQSCAASVIDLPGIYSLSTFSLEEVVTREYLAEEKPDVTVNVIGASVLERNLFFTLQLLEMEIPLVICLNQMDVAEKQGMSIDVPRLEALLGVPVVPAIAVRGKGVRELAERAIWQAEHKSEGRRSPLRFSAEIEHHVEELAALIDSEHLALPYSSRWLAIKLLEGDTKIRELAVDRSEKVVRACALFAGRIEATHRQPAFAVITSERYALASRIAGTVQEQKATKRHFSDALERFATHKIYGYIVALTVIAGLLVWTFAVGTYFSNLLTQAFGFFQPVNPQVSGTIWGVLWNGVFGGLVAGVTLVIPYVVPFYLMLALLEDSGVLTRVAFMVDSAMHRAGLHGKAIIPIILGYGCNVPAIYSTRVMETRRERLLTAFAITFSPCAARTVVIFGLVAAFVSVQWALALYAIDILLVAIVLKVAAKAVPGELTGLVMEMHSFKVPSLTVISKQTWVRTKSLIYMVFPIYMIGSALVQGAYALGLLGPVNQALSFLTVGWLGLPLVAGILLIFGAARKELILLMAVTLLGADLGAALTPPQLIVLALVGVIYPCFATIGSLTKEFGWKPAWTIIGANLAVALLVGGIAAKLLTLFS